MIVRSLVAAVALLGLAGCAKDGDIDETGGIAITRSACPAVAVPADVGDVTLFNPPSSREARAIDVVATIINVRPVCNDQGTDIISNATFEVIARRSDASGPREVVLPYFATVLQGGSAIVAKHMGTVRINFSAGQLRASAQGQGGAVIDRATATLPPNIREILTKKRKAGQVDAATDPLSTPEVKAAVSKASFELLIGFQLTNEQLQYNATR